MSQAGIRTSNLPRGRLIELLGHADAGGGALTLRRMAIGEFVNMVRGLAGGEPSAVADVATDVQHLYEALQEDRNNLDRTLVELRSQVRDETEAREEGDGALWAGVAENLLAALAAVLGGSRPGISPAAFSASAVGGIADAGPLDPAGGLATAFGRAYCLNGAALIAPRATIPVDPDQIWILRVRYHRLADVLDPNNNAVDVGIQWLDAEDRDAGRALLHREKNLRVQDGPRSMTFRLPLVGGEGLAATTPQAAVSWRPYLRTYGADGATGVALLGATEATFAGVYAPDVTDLAARLSALQGRIDAGLPISTHAPTSFAVVDLPRPNPAAPGRRAWARDGRARQADGSLEPANAGTGVSVEDNGAKWVISGTNQQVQA